jgi:pullulanase
VAFRLKNYAGRDDWRNIIVILNPSKKSHQVNIPQEAYVVVCRDGVINEKGLATFEGCQVEVNAQSALILHD